MNKHMKHFFNTSINIHIKKDLICKFYESEIRFELTTR